MDIRDIIVDGVEQLAEWLDANLEGLTPEQLNWLPDGKTVSIGFHTWHITRTADNITNFVFRGQKPIWLVEGYLERMGLPKNEQGTGMDLEVARTIKIDDLPLLREYGQKVFKDTLDFIKHVPLASLEEVQMIKPLGEMPKWRVLRQVIMTHGFMHLGEIQTNKGLLGISAAL